jgi:penicillin-binding protein 1C
MAFDDPAADQQRQQAAPGLVKLDNPDAIGPQILFPPNNAEIVVTQRGVALSARGGAGALSWYAEGAPIVAEPTSGRTIWKPSGEGFFDVMVVDGEGRSAKARVRVRKG